MILPECFSSLNDIIVGNGSVIQNVTRNITCTYLKVFHFDQPNSLLSESQYDKGMKKSVIVRALRLMI